MHSHTKRSFIDVDAVRTCDWFDTALQSPDTAATVASGHRAQIAADEPGPYDVALIA